MATGFGVGYFPVAPGTAGSLLGLVLFLLLRYFSPLVYGSVLLVVLLLGFYTAGRAEEAFQRIDPSQVVIDEIGGMLATYFLLPTGMSGIVLGFCFFRLFDITKPPPIRWLQELPGGTGIMLDDLAAAGYAQLLTRWVLWWIG